MPTILCLDTSGPVCSVALDRGGEVSVLTEHLPRAHAQIILTQVQSLCVAAKLELKELDAIAVLAGPGSFTGIRIGVAVAQGLAFACSRPVVLISSLAALAQTAADKFQVHRQLVALKARDQEIYFAVYARGAEGVVELEGEEQVIAPVQVSLSGHKLELSDCIGIGDGWEYHALLSGALGSLPGSIHSESVHSADAICRLARRQFARGELVAAEQAVPSYIKESMNYRKAD